ncbi:MAG: 2-amino-4-hydroxy-6-hydroxymethyldihydropteridine diphosphokinase [Planctomycetia bacterium]|nr:2-amino-4-hydroxy-6-hydroxymethyldihydropteridine diphosphokinase [Planctomycetia bacterium]
MTERFAAALAWADELHRSQFRKGGKTPYVSHLLRVAGLALEFGADEETAIAALLHDAVEDQGGLETADEIERRFGKRVRKLVCDCSDSMTGRACPKKPWRERKEKYLKHLNVASARARLISLCDKIDNLTSIVRDVEQYGLAVFDRFHGGLDGTVWYYEEVVRILTGHKMSGVAELERLLSRLKELIRSWQAREEDQNESPQPKGQPGYALLGLGSNRGDRRKYLAAARVLLEKTPGIVIRQFSSLYETLPQGGPAQQRNYYNATALVETTLTPRELLAATQNVEAQLHRKRTVHWGPRTIDVDILLYNDLEVNEPDLIVPHPRWSEREFVLVPAVETLWRELVQSQ